MAVGGVLVAWWFWAVAGDANGYDFAQGFFASAIGKLLLFSWTICTFYHLANGVRHLFWDVGLGFELRAVYASGVVVVVAAVALTLLAWFI